MKTLLTLLALVALSTEALAQKAGGQTTFYGSSGRSVGTATTDSAGSTTFRDAGGRTTNRTSTDSQGTTTVYDSGGRAVGRFTSPPAR